MDSAGITSGTCSIGDGRVHTCRYMGGETIPAHAVYNQPQTHERVMHCDLLISIVTVPRNLSAALVAFHETFLLFFSSVTGMLVEYLHVETRVLLYIHLHVYICM